MADKYMRILFLPFSHSRIWVPSLEIIQKSQEKSQSQLINKYPEEARVQL